MKKIFIAILTVLTLSSFGQTQGLTDTLALENTHDIKRLYDEMGKISDRLSALEATNPASALDSLKKELKGVVTKSWVVQEIVNRAVLDTTYAGNKKIRRRDGKPLMHRQLVLQQKQNQRIAVQASADVFTVQEYLDADEDSSAVLLKKLRANTKKIKEKAKAAGFKNSDVMDGKVVIIR